MYYLITTNTESERAERIIMDKKEKELMNNLKEASIASVETPKENKEVVTETVEEEITMKTEQMFNVLLFAAAIKVTAVAEVKYLWYLLNEAEESGASKDQLKALKSKLYRIKVELPEAFEAAKKEADKKREARRLSKQNKWGVSSLCAGINTRERELITRAHEVTHLMGKVKRQEHTAYAIPSVAVMKDRSVQGVQPTAANYMTQYVETHLHTAFLQSAIGTYSAVERVFMGQLYLTINSLEEFKELVGIDLEAGTTDLKYFHETLINGKWVLTIDEGDGRQKRLSDGLLIENKDVFFNKDNSKRHTWTYDFCYALSSAGAMKKNGILLAGVYEGPEPETYAFDWEKMMDLTTCGSWRMNIEYAPDTLTPGQIAQLSMRYAQQLAPQSVLTDAVPIPTALFVPGKFKMEANGEEVEHMDGLFLKLATYEARMLNEAFPELYVTDDAVVGQQSQERPYNSVKATSVVVDLHLMKAAIGTYSQKFKKGLVLINGDKADLTTRREFYRYSASKGKDGKFGGYAVMLVYPSVLKKYFADNAGNVVWPKMNIAGKEYPAPAIFVDFNACKTGIDPVYKTGCRKMNSAHCDSDEGVTSVQTLQSLFIADYKETMEMVKNRTTAMVEAKEEKMFKTVAKDNAPQNMATSSGIDWMTIQRQTLPTLAQKYNKTAYRHDGEKAVEGLARMIETCNFVTPAITQMMMPDVIAVLLGKPVLRTFTKKIRGKILTDYVEVYSTTVPAGTYGIMVRFPKAGRAEFIKVRVISADTLSGRIYGLTDRETTQHIVKLLKNTSEGIVMVPVNGLILKGLGGADFDGDKCKIYVATQSLSSYENGTAEPDEFDLLCDVPSLIVDKDFVIK